MKKLWKILQYYAVIPFVASAPGFILCLGGLSELCLAAVPLTAALLCFFLRKKTDAALAARVYGAAAVLLPVCFMAMMMLCSGAIEGMLMSNFCWLIFPFAPVMLMHMLMGQTLLLYAEAMLTYVLCFAVMALAGGIEPEKKKKLWMPAALICLCAAISAGLYADRPAARYAGHGFAYMHGYSSTDLSDYMVYSDPCLLAEPDDPQPYIIENEADMPVLDGAEACYPLYAAFAKAAYKDIDRIEEEWIRTTDRPYCNGKIVTFTNTVMGFNRLVFGAKDPDKWGDTADMFFGARPSAEELEWAEGSGVEVDITPIGREAFVFFVEADSPVSDLTADQIRAIYHGDITNWSRLGGRDQAIRAFQRPRNSGSQTMMEYFMGDVSLKEPLTYEMVSAMDGIIRQVAQYADEEGAIGYSFRYFVEELHQEQNVKILSVNGVYPTLESIEDGSYPLSVDLCMITRRSDAEPNVQKMKDFILSEAGQSIIRKTGYAGLPR